MVLLNNCCKDQNEPVDPHFVGAMGGTVESLDKTVSVEIPEGALTTNTTISIESTSMHPDGNLGEAYEFGPDETHFNDFVTITINYTDDIIDGDESNLRMAFARDDAWFVIPSFIDKENNKLKGIIDHFTTFGILRLPSRSIVNIIWDVEINYNPMVSWHADVIFYNDGTTKYDEPDNPGLYLSYGHWTQKENEIIWDIGVGPNYIYTGELMGNTMSGTSVTGTWSAMPKADTLILCGPTPTPPGYIVISYGKECQTIGNSTYFSFTAKNIAGLPTGSTVEKCGVEPNPEGWVTIDWTGICSQVAGITFFGEIIEKIEGMPSGTVIETCSLDAIPNGWEEVGEGTTCAKVANIYFSQRTIIKL